MTRAIIVALAAALALAGCDNAGDAGSRNQIRAVGSSTVYPFATAVAEQFVNKNPKFKIADHRIDRYRRRVQAVLRRRRRGAPRHRKRVAPHQEIRIRGVSKERRQPHRRNPDRPGRHRVRRIEQGTAPAAERERRLQGARRQPVWQTAGPPRRGGDVNPALPAEPIRVYGPPSTSGTRDALAELILMRGCDVMPEMRDLAESKPDEHKKVCTTIREDGAYVDAGENDNLIVQKIEADPKAIGIFGFSFMEEKQGPTGRQHAERRRPDLCDDIRLHLSRRASALHLRQVGAYQGDRRVEGIHRRICRRLGPRRLPQATRDGACAGPGARAVGGDSEGDDAARRLDA